MAAALDFTYRYAFPSNLAQANDGQAGLTLATCNLDHATPYFFDGRVRSPRALGAMLTVLSDVVRTHFFLPMPPNLDPVLTSNENLLRLEGFSGCCGVYARVDLPAEAFEGDCHGRGTTNVDFNEDMRRALTRLRDQDDVRFAVGKDEVLLERAGDQTVEKKVKLPARWIKGFSEVQAFQPRLSLVMETSAGDALRFLRSLPPGGRSKIPNYVVSAGKGIRVSHRAQKGAVSFWGSHRIKVLEPLLPHAQRLRIWNDPDSGASAWEVCFPVGSFFLLISPEVYRGFSGEGQVLEDLAATLPDGIMARVRAALRWQSEIDAVAIAEEIDSDEAIVNRALARLGSRGLAGFDAGTGQYFHRELPFDLDQVEAMQPRLKGARKLVSEGGVVADGSGANDERVFQVRGTEVTHRVVLSPDGDRCTCPWFSKHLGQRGPCKHILAAQITEDDRQADLIS